MTDIMTFFPDMEIIRSDMMSKVLRLSENYNPAAYTHEDVKRTLESEQVTTADFAALLSTAGLAFLEQAAQKARQQTKKRFGNSVYLFTPLYISNYCENHCVYCGFNCKSGVCRAKLNLVEIDKEMRAIAAEGLDEILILTGESPANSNVEYIGEACKTARKYFKVVGLETYPVNTCDYAYLHECGADFVTVFQETYQQDIYSKLHLAGRKRCYPYRFYSQERALQGGMRGVGFAALLGIGDFRKDAFATGVHAALIQKKYPHAEITISCPRLRPAFDGDKKVFEGNPVSEAELFQIITAFRLFLPQANITISSRERAGFRDNIVDIAATKISAGVDVGVGRHSAAVTKGDGQFKIEDSRSVYQIYKMLKERGLQPVMSDYIYV